MSGSTALPASQLAMTRPRPPLHLPRVPHFQKQRPALLRQVDLGVGGVGVGVAEEEDG